MSEEFELLKKHGLVKEKTADTPADTPPPTDTPPAVDTPPGDTPPPVDTPPPAPSDTPAPADTPPPTDTPPPAPADTPAPTPPVDNPEIDSSNVPNIALPNHPVDGGLNIGVINDVLGSNFSSVDEFRQSKLADRLQNETALSEKYGNLQAHIKNIENPFANEDIAKYNEFVKSTGIHSFTVFEKINSFDPDANNHPIDVLITAAIVKEPSYINQMEDLRAYYKEKYNYDEETYASNFDLKMAADDAKTVLREHKSSIKTPETVNIEEQVAQRAEAQKQKDEKLRTDWGAVLDNYMQDSSAKKIVLNKKGVEGEFTTFEIPNDKLIQYRDDALELLVGQQKELHKDNLRFVHQVIQERAWRENKAEILHTYAEKVRSLSDDEWEGRVHNPTTIESRENPEAQEAEGKPETQEEQSRRIIDMEGKV